MHDVENSDVTVGGHPEEARLLGCLREPLERSRVRSGAGLADMPVLDESADSRGPRLYLREPLTASSTPSDSSVVTRP